MFEGIYKECITNQGGASFISCSHKHIRLCLHMLNRQGPCVLQNPKNLIDRYLKSNGISKNAKNTNSIVTFHVTSVI